MVLFQECAVFPAVQLKRNQTSANNSNSPRYSKTSRWFGKHLCMNLWKKTLSYSTQPQVEYLYFGRLWGLLVELSQAKLFGNKLNVRCLIHQFYDLASTQQRLQSFSIRLDDESQVGTLLLQNLKGTVLSALYFLQEIPLFAF